MTKDQTFSIRGEWYAICDGKIIEATFNSKGAAEAAIQVEKRRNKKKKELVDNNQ